MATAADRIGSYVLEGELGRGAFGVVYRAHQADRPDVPVALKVVENRGNLDRLMLEPALLAKLRHPCIVRLEDYFLDEDRLVLALEFINGEDLKTCAECGEVFDQAQVRDLLVQMAGALAHAHAHGVIHRDIKLSNILVDRTQGRPRFVLTDFGIGRETEGIQAQKRTGGTYAFMAPEQLRGRPCPQSDLWALGVVAYRLLTGKLPFTGQTVNELSSQIFYAVPEPPSKCSAGPVDAEFEAVVFRLLEKSLTERTASAEELLRELGHKGAADAVTPQVRPAPRPAPAGRVSLDRRIQRKLFRYQVLVGLFMTLYVAQKGLGTGLLLVAALVLFFLAHQRRHWSRTRTALALVGSFVLMAGSTALSYSGLDLTLLHLGAWRPDVPDDVATSTGFLVLMGALLVLLVIVSFLLPFLPAYCFGVMRQLQRIRAVRRAALESGSDPEKYLETMRAFLDYRFEDVGFHLKYIEALLARGRLKEVAVEARILLRQDPYNFSGNLHLANAYFALGLLEDCAGVCDRYLGVAGYCFEFSELKQQCTRKLEAVT
jgi:serine/threonine-protein kinase